MTSEILIEIVLLGLALSVDAFAVAVTDGLIYSNINKKKSVFIAFMFGLFQALMPLAGFWLIELAALAVGGSGAEAGRIMKIVVTWTAFGLLIFIGGKMILEGIRERQKEEPEKKLFSFKEVLYFAFATSIDALGSGVALHSGLSTTNTVWFHCGILLLITFVLSLIGVFFGKAIVKVLKGRLEITQIIGGVILMCLAVWIVLSHYLNI